MAFSETRSTFREFLDMCFTEERFAFGGGEVMADVEDVKACNIADNFEDLVPYGEWTRFVFLFCVFCALTYVSFQERRRTTRLPLSTSNAGAMWRRL